MPLCLNRPFVYCHGIEFGNPRRKTGKLLPAQYFSESKAFIRLAFVIDLWRLNCNRRVDCTYNECFPFTWNEGVCGKGGIAPPNLTSVLDGSKWPSSRHDLFTPEKHGVLKMSVMFMLLAYISFGSLKLPSLWPFQHNNAISFTISCDWLQKFKDLEMEHKIYKKEIYSAPAGLQKCWLLCLSQFVHILFKLMSRL